MYILTKTFLNESKISKNGRVVTVTSGWSLFCAIRSLEMFIVNGHLQGYASQRDIKSSIAPAWITFFDPAFLYLVETRLTLDENSNVLFRWHADAKIGFIWYANWKRNIRWNYELCITEKAHKFVLPKNVKLLPPKSEKTFHESLQILSPRQKTYVPRIY